MYLTAALMLSPDSGLLIWQIVILVQFLGAILSLILLYRQPISYKTKTSWCFLILFVPLGWLVYLAFRKLAHPTKA